MMRRPPASVVVPTRAPWPGVQPVVDALSEQIRATGVELVIADGTDHGNALDRRAAALPDPLVRVCARSGADVFELRALGTAAAQGEIVAITEDHCVPEADYLATILAAHERHPELAVAGAVVNGSTDRAIDRVNFLLVHARNVPPRDSLPGSGWIPTPSNISYKRRCLPAEPPVRGWLETVHNVRLLQDAQLVFDERIVVRHVQSTGRVGTFRNHFHAGRSMGGLGRDGVAGRLARLRWALGSSACLPGRLVRPAWREMRRHPSGGSVLLTPLAVAVSVADAIGFVCGVVAGPGQSADRVQ